MTADDVALMPDAVLKECLARLVLLKPFSDRQCEPELTLVIAEAQKRADAAWVEGC